MQRIETSLPGVSELRSIIHGDARGFIETYHRAKFANPGILDIFIQDNLSCSNKGTLLRLGMDDERLIVKAFRNPPEHFIPAVCSKPPFQSHS